MLIKECAIITKSFINTTFQYYSKTMSFGTKANEGCLCHTCHFTWTFNIWPFKCSVCAVARVLFNLCPLCDSVFLFGLSGCIFNGTQFSHSSVKGKWYEFQRIRWQYHSTTLSALQNHFIRAYLVDLFISFCHIIWIYKPHQIFLQCAGC